MRPFSIKYRTFTEWIKSGTRNTRYAKEIIKKHYLMPELALNDLRNARISKATISKKAFHLLDDHEKDLRLGSLKVLSRLRRGESFKAMTKEVDISSTDLKRHLSDVIYRKRGRIVARKTDTIQRRMRIYENGRITTLTTRTSRDSSRIGQYMGAVRQALKTGDDKPLQKFRNMVITDANGKKHRFETDLEKLYDIEEQKENPEFWEVYADE